MPEYLGLSSAIISTLREFNRTLPIDYLARVHGRRVVDIMDNIQSLEAAGAIRVSDDGDMVSLAQTARGESDPGRELVAR